jgi:hypothetical protein
MRSLALVLVAILAFLQPTEAQTPSQRRTPRRESTIIREFQSRASGQTEARKLFDIIEHGIVSSTFAPVATHFAQQVFVNMSGGESGYFSANQTVSILQQYLSSRTSLSFEFSKFSDTGSTPYATGRLTFNSRGRRESAQVYVSLRFQDSRWVINQFNIY